MKSVVIFFAILIGGSIAFYTALQNGSLLHYFDTHPNPQTVPAAEFYIGSGYYLWSDLQNAATYYQRIVERYPKSKYSEEAQFNYLQALDDMNTSRHAMADAYTAFLERYPHSSHIEVVQKRIEYCRNSH